MMGAGVRGGEARGRWGVALGAWLALTLAWAPLLAEPSGDAAARYSHRAHEALGIKLTCSGCHGTSSSGVLTMVGQDDHKPCANQACHADAFRKADAKLCQVCHEHNEAWRSNPVRGAFRDTGEFWVGFSHKTHLGRSDKGALAGKGCGTCHPTQSGEAPAPRPSGVLAPGHGLCASCHEGLAEPKMTSCDGCHKLESGSGHAASPEEPGAWRVAAKFEHGTHRLDIRTAKEVVGSNGQGWAHYAQGTAKALDCKGCHGEVVQAEAGARLPRPTMEGCASCHDGRYAFKATGFACTTCHGPTSAAGGKATASR